MSQSRRQSPRAAIREWLEHTNQRPVEDLTEAVVPRLPGFEGEIANHKFRDGLAIKKSTSKVVAGRPKRQDQGSFETAKRPEGPLQVW